MSDMPANLFDFTLPCGKRLGDASKAEILAAAECYAREGRAANARAAFLEDTAEAAMRRAGAA